MIINEQDGETGFYVPRHERDPVEVASRCKLVGKPSSQFSIFLLPEEFNYDAWLDDMSQDVSVEVQRLLKVAHATEGGVLAITEILKIGDATAREDKLEELILAGRQGVGFAMSMASRFPRIDKLFGYPLMANDYREDTWKDGYHMAYTQDYVRPVADILTDLDVENNEEDLRIACGLVDRYVDTQLLLCTFGMAESTFKFADNCGRCVNDELAIDEDGGFKIIDLGELETNKERVLESIRTKKWRNITSANQPEATQLPPIVQQYLNDAFESRFTEERVNALWGSAYGDNTEEYLGASRRPTMLDRSLPSDLPGVLWENIQRREKEGANEKLIDRTLEETPSPTLLDIYLGSSDLPLAIAHREYSKRLFLLYQGETLDIVRDFKSIGKPSAQFDVILLPDIYNRDVSPTGRFDDTVEMSRVLKLPLPDIQIVKAVQKMGISDPREAEEKMKGLKAGRHAGNSLVGGIAQVKELHRLFGYPAVAIGTALEASKEYGYSAPYTQDFVRPLPQIFNALDTEHNEADLRTACRLIDAFIDEAELGMCDYGLFDCIYKLDNCGESQPMDESRIQTEYERMFAQRRFRVIDFHELESDLEKVVKSVKERRWRENASKPPEDYTPLPPSVQEYFEYACETRLTEDVIRARWKSKLPRSVGESKLTNLRYRIETNVSPYLCEKLAERCLQDSL